jgi:hypothetical protein
MMNYREEFEKLVSMLTAHPLIADVQYLTNDGVREAVITQTCSTPGFRPEEDLLDFYRFSNGLTITVRLNEQKVIQHNYKVKDYPLPSAHDTENPYIGLSIVDFDTLFQKSWFNFPENDPVDFANAQYSLHELSGMIKPFDTYSEFACFGAFINPAQKVLRLLMLDAHYDAWFSSRLTSFEIYVRFLLKTGCIAEARRRYFYATEGHVMPPITDPEFISSVETPDFFRNF